MKTMTLIAALILGGCAAEPASPDAGVAEAGMAAATAAALDTAALADHSLAASSLPAMRLVATPYGRDVLSRLVSCALPRGTAITAMTAGGTPYSFAGSLGLAPDWAYHAPDRSERRRVTECVRAKTVGSTAA